MPPEAFVIDYEKLTLVGAMAIAIIAFAKGWIVPGPTYERNLNEMAQERNNEREEKLKWQEIAFDAIRSTESLATTAEKIVRSGDSTASTSQARPRKGP